MAKENKYYSDSPILIPNSNVQFFDQMRNELNNNAKSGYEAGGNFAGIKFGTGYNLGVGGSIENFKVSSSFPKTKK